LIFILANIIYFIIKTSQLYYCLSDTIKIKMATVLISGGSGLIGKALTKKLLAKGYIVKLLSRRKTEVQNDCHFQWDIESQFIEKEAVANTDYIIHLAGENIGKKRWTSARKQEILKSRLQSTQLLFNAIKENNFPLKAFISASAIGYYGAVSSEHIFDETDENASDFLGKTCHLWENAVDQFQTLGIRTLKLRTGVVLSNNGGALNKMALPIKLGIGAALGSGKQYMPWIHIDDLCEIYIKAIEDNEMHGAYNAVAPDDKTNEDFIHGIAKALHQRIFLPNIPAFVLKLMLGEMSDMILKGSRVSSAKIEKTGFKFQFPSLETALTNIYQ
jgi:uncharacterized protein (TIGR01777 family)